MLSESGGTYKGRCHRNRAPLVPRLHDGRVEAAHGVRQGVEVAGQQSVQGEVRVELVEELHQARWYVLWVRQVRGEGQGGAHTAPEGRGGEERVLA